MTELRYLCECPLYNNIRLTLFDKLRQIPSSVCLQTLLFGDDSQSLSDNKRAVEIVIHSYFFFSRTQKVNDPCGQHIYIQVQCSTFDIDKDK